MIPDRTVRNAFAPLTAVSYTQATGCTPIIENPGILGYIADGAQALYRSLDFGMGAGYFTARATTPFIGGAIEIWVADSAGQPASRLGICRIPNTGSWDSWVQVHVPIQPVHGVQDIVLVFRRTAGDNVLSLFELDCFSFLASPAGLVRDGASRILAIEADNITAPVRVVRSEEPAEDRVTSGYVDGCSLAFSRIQVSPDHEWLEARVWIPSAGATLEIHFLDPQSGESRLAGELVLDAAWGRRKWVTAGCAIQPCPGCTFLELRYRDPAGKKGFKLGWIQFARLRHASRPFQRLVTGPLLASNWSLALGAQSEPCSEGGDNIGYLRDGSFIRFDWVDFGPEKRRLVQCRVAAVAAGGAVDVLVDGRRLASLEVPCTGEWQRWTTVTARLSEGVEGIHRLECRFRGSNGFLFNLRWIDFPAGPDGVLLELPANPRVVVQGEDAGFAAMVVHRPESPRTSARRLLFLPPHSLPGLAGRLGLALTIQTNPARSTILTGPRGRLVLDRTLGLASFEPWGPEAGDGEAPGLALQSPQPESAALPGPVRLEWPLPPETLELAGSPLVPAAALAPALGILHDDQVDAGLVELWVASAVPAAVLAAAPTPEPAASASPGAPPQVPPVRPAGQLALCADGGLRTSGNELLRGPTYFMDNEPPPSRAQLAALQRLGFNALHVYGPSRDSCRQPGDHSDIIDLLVEFTAQTGLQLVLGCSSGKKTGRVDREWVRSFWAGHAPRYAHCRHVIFELARQPHPAGAPYPTDLLAFQREILDLLAGLAPANLVVLFSYVDLTKPEAILRDLQALHLADAERQRVVVGWVGWDRQLDRVASCLRVLRRQGWPTLNVQLPYALRGDTYDPLGTMADQDLLRLCAATDTGWLSSVPLYLLNHPGLPHLPGVASGINKV